MTTHPAAARLTRPGPMNRIHVRRRPLVVSGAVLAVALLVAGCSGGSTSTDGPTAPSAPAASVGDAFDHIGPRQGDEAGVAAVNAAWDAAWNAGDGNAIGALFLADAEFVNGRGQVALGAATIGANHSASLAGVFKGAHTVGTIRRISFLSGTTAVLDVDNTVTGFRSLPPGVVATEPGMLRQRHKRVLVKRGGTWRTESMQLTALPPTPPAP